MNPLHLIALILFSAVNAFAGAISGGGGGVILPNPAQPKQVVETIQKYSGQVIWAWLNQQELKFSALTEDERQKSPFKKLFSNTTNSSQNIFSVLKAMHIDLKLSIPCYDAFGEEKDGSVSLNGSFDVCISAFTIPPKVDQYMAASETTALLIHELSHFMGTDEAEAETLQKLALEDLHNTDFEGLLLTVNEIANGKSKGGMSEIMDIIFHILQWMNEPETLTTLKGLSWSHSFEAFADKLAPKGSKFLFTQNSRLKNIWPELTRFSVIQNFRCVADLEVDGIVRRMCLARENAAFQESNEITARYWIAQGQPSQLGPEYDQVIIKRPRTLDDASAELKKVNEAIQALSIDLRNWSEFALQTAEIK